MQQQTSYSSMQVSNRNSTTSHSSTQDRTIGAIRRISHISKHSSGRHNSNRQRTQQHHRRQTGQGQGSLRATPYRRRKGRRLANGLRRPVGVPRIINRTGRASRGNTNRGRPHLLQLHRRSLGRQGTKYRRRQRNRASRRTRAARSQYQGNVRISHARFTSNTSLGNSVTGRQHSRVNSTTDGDDGRRVSSRAPGTPPFGIGTFQVANS